MSKSKTKSTPTTATTIRLALLSGNRCANPNCRCEIVSPDGRENVGESAHVHGRSDGGPRAIRDLSDEARNSIDNLIYLCSNCHTRIDQNADAYPAELLFEWKETHRKRVANGMGTEFAKIAFEDLDIAADRIIKLSEEEIKTTGDFEKPLIKLKEKIQKHKLSSDSKFLINNAYFAVSTVREFIRTHTSEESEATPFSERIRSGILMIYHRHRGAGLIHDELFLSMLYELKGALSLGQQAAVTALVVYYMEHCDLFSE